MSYRQPGGESDRTGGLLGGVKRLLASFTAILGTRLEIFSIELQEEGSRFGRLVVLALLAIFFFAMGILLATLFFVALFWETHGLQVLGGLTLFYLTAAAIAALILRHRLGNMPRLFSTTVSELRKDYDRLSSRS